MATILLVEDNPQNMKLAELVLRNAGHQVLQAVDAYQALELARLHRPPLVLMDINLPGIDGLEATRRIRADPLHAGIKIYALTAYALPGDEARMLAAGCDGYLCKPIHHKELQRLVETALRSPT